MRFNQPVPVEHKTTRSAQALARTTLDDDRVLVEVLGPPNAIGVCQVRWQGRTYARHYARLEPTTDAARDLLGGGDRFVQRDARTAYDPKRPEQPQIEGWRIEHIELLREMLAADLLESEMRRRRDPKRHAQRIAAVQYVNRWLKRERLARTSEAAGLDPEQARDPRHLLGQARRVMWRLGRQAREAGLDGMTDQEIALTHAIGQYLQHYAGTSADEMPDKGG